MNDPIVTGKHMHIARSRHGGYCVQGADAWFARYGLSLRVFLRDGYPASVFDAIGDELGITMARIAREEQGAG